MTKDEALKLALEALEGADMIDCDMRDAITAIKEALAQPEHCSDCGQKLGDANHIHTCSPQTKQDGKCKYCSDGCPACDARKLSEQEPVAWRYRMPVEDGHWVWNYATYIDDPKDQQCEPLYTTPPQRKPLTDKEIEALWLLRPTDEIVAFARAIEAKLKEKNT